MGILKNIKTAYDENLKKRKRAKEKNRKSSDINIGGQLGSVRDRQKKLDAMLKEIEKRNK